MLDVGQTIRYRGLGAGTVVEHVTRRFQNQDRLFAVVDFPHRDLTAQIPIGDPAVAAKVEPVMKKTAIQRLMRDLPERGRVLPRTWDAREEIGEAAIKGGGPEEWAELLASYARAEGAGVSVSTSDDDLVRQACDLLAAEMACAMNIAWEEALEKVEAAYDRAAKASGERHSEPAEHFAAVAV